MAIAAEPILLVYGTLNAASYLHNGLLTRIMGATQHFFDTTPKGRILSRFSCDIYTLDTVMPLKIKQIIVATFRVRYKCTKKRFKFLRYMKNASLIVAVK